MCDGFEFAIMLPSTNGTNVGMKSMIPRQVTWKDLETSCIRTHDPNYSWEIKV